MGLSGREVEGRVGRQHWGNPARKGRLGSSQEGKTWFLTMGT